METHSSSSHPSEPGAAAWRTARRALVALAILVTLVAAFYAFENWRGQRAWEQVKRELAAKGEVLDWFAYIPKPVPDDQNIFKAPKMEEWFIRGGSGELTRKIGANSLTQSLQANNSNAVVELKLVSPGESVDAAAADVLLRYENAVWSLATPEVFGAPATPIPLITLDAAPLPAAIQNLARQAGVSYVIAPQVLDEWESWEPAISIQWENLTARQALLALLNTYNLELIGSPQTGVARLVKRGSAGRHGSMTDEARAQVINALKDAIQASQGSNALPTLSSIRQMRFVTGEQAPARPVRILVLSEELPDAQAIQTVFPAELARLRSGVSGWRARADAANVFRLFPTYGSVCSAQDYLQWSDQFAPEFDLIREALRRPVAQLAGDYQQPFSLPIPDFVCARNLAQLLAERAQCQLLLGQPAAALRELTLLHDLRRLLAGKPTMLVAAMIDVAITGLYTEVIADGLRLNAWREPELAVLQQQLAGVKLLPSVAAALRTERAASCQTLLNVPPDKVAELFVAPGSSPSPWKQMTDPVNLLLRVAPRGWVHQNLVTVARMNHPAGSGVFGPEPDLVRPARMPHDADFQKQLGQPHPFNILARVAVPNFIRAVEVTARKQAKANQAQVVCALERYRLAHGNYPDSLAALTPKFLEQVPRDCIGGAALKYQREANGEFLLYSIGWNETDDGGKTTRRADGSIDDQSPDWVWRLELP